MTRKPHELSDEFPDQIKLIRQLKGDNQHFSRLCEEYDVINHDIHLAETNVQPTDELTEHDMRKKRLALKDEIWQMLKSAQSPA